MVFSTGVAVLFGMVVNSIGLGQGLWLAILLAFHTVGLGYMTVMRLLVVIIDIDCIQWLTLSVRIVVVLTLVVLALAGAFAVKWLAYS